MPFPANQMVNYVHVFNWLLTAICLVAVHAIASHQEHLHDRYGQSLHVLFFQPRKLCPTAIKLQVEWGIPWTSCRIFGWFTYAFLGSLNSALISQAGSYVITKYCMGWKPVISCYLVISLLLHSTSALPQSYVITTIPSLYGIQLILMSHGQ